jgi:hypothetical protein
MAQNNLIASCRKRVIEDNRANLLRVRMGETFSAKGPTVSKWRQMEFTRLAEPLNVELRLRLVDHLVTATDGERLEHLAIVIFAACENKRAVVFVRWNDVDKCACPRLENLRVSAEASKGEVRSKSSRTTNRFPSSRCASTIQIVRHSQSTADTQAPTPFGFAEIVSDDLPSTSRDVILPLFALHTAKTK